MHQPIRDHLEDYLSDPDDRNIPPEFRAHLASCNTCANELRDLDIHTDLLRILRPASVPEIGPGFYAAVMNRIEEQRPPDSLWSSLVDPAFGKRLAYACATFVLLLGAYLASTESSEHPQTPSGLVSLQNEQSDVQDGTVQASQRNAVLVNLVSYQE